MHISAQNIMLKAFSPGQFRYFHLTVLCNRTYDMRGTGWYSWLRESLRYKPGGRGFDSCWFHWDFLLT
jgi:hypothetical protein